MTFVCGAGEVNGNISSMAENHTVRTIMIILISQMDN